MGRYVCCGLVLPTNWHSYAVKIHLQIKRSISAERDFKHQRLLAYFLCQQYLRPTLPLLLINLSAPVSALFIRQSVAKTVSIKCQQNVSPIKSFLILAENSPCAFLHYQLSTEQSLSIH
jgi:hypothetical protein